MSVACHCTHAGPKHEALLLRFADHATSKAVLNTFKACDVAQVVWTYATFAQEDHLLMVCASSPPCVLASYSRATDRTTDGSVQGKREGKDKSKIWV